MMVRDNGKIGMIADSEKEGNFEMEFGLALERTETKEKRNVLRKFGVF
jgi:hypothetical protein